MKFKDEEGFRRCSRVYQDTKLWLLLKKTMKKELKQKTASQVKWKQKGHTALNKSESSDRFVVFVHFGLMQIFFENGVNNR